MEQYDLDGLHVEGETFDAFRRDVADAVTELLEVERRGADEAHVEFVAHSSAAPEPP